MTGSQGELSGGGQEGETGRKGNTPLAREEPSGGGGRELPSRWAGLGALQDGRCLCVFPCEYALGRVSLRACHCTPACLPAGGLPPEGPVLCPLLVSSPSRGPSLPPSSPSPWEKSEDVSRIFLPLPGDRVACAAG